jgi:ankyrin repeat protein
MAVTTSVKVLIRRVLSRSPIGEIALMLSLPGRPCELDGLARRAISLGGDEFHDCNTIIHDAIFGRSKLSLQESLNIEPKSIDKLDAAGLSPLHWAVHRNNVTAVEILLNWKAPVDLVTRGERRTALHIAARSGNVLLAKMLLDAGAEINYRDIYQRTALCLAALSGAAELVYLLLCQGADVHAQETDGITVIQRAIEPDTHPKDEQAIELIVEKLAQFGADLNCEGRSGETPIMTAIRYNSPAAFRELVSRGARLEKKDSKGWTVLHYAASFANTSMIQALEKVNMSIVDPDSHDHTGKTAEAVLDEKLEEGGNGETATAAVSFREMIATVKLEYSKQMGRLVINHLCLPAENLKADASSLTPCRESTKQYQSEDDSGTETYEDCSEYYQ